MHNANSLLLVLDLLAGKLHVDVRWLGFGLGQAGSVDVRSTAHCYCTLSLHVLYSTYAYCTHHALPGARHRDIAYCYYTH